MTALATDDVIRAWGDAQPDVREPLIVLEPLIGFLRERNLADGAPRVAPLGDGLSNATFALSFESGAELVLRRPPRGPLPPSAHDVLREAHIIDRLSGGTVPVPRILAVCPNADVIGAPFYIAERLAGSAPVTALPPALENPVQRRRFGDQLADTLAALHATDLEAVGLAELGRPTGYLTRQIDRHKRLWEHSQTRECPAVDLIAEWLLETLPAEREVTLVHGDFHPANVMLADDAPARIVAVLDWELASRGDPMADVGYLSALWREADDPPHHPLERGPVTRGKGSLRREELLERYQQVSGRPVDGVGWYEVLALWRAVIFMEGNFKRARSGAADTPFLRGAADHASRLSELALQRMGEVEAGR